ncbi:MAG: class I SAM-dependent methyltransferase, partial [Candidatus Hodarchaeota archaeon]
MNQNLTKDFIFKLYHNWVTDLKKVRKYERDLYNERCFSKLKQSIIYRVLRFGLEKLGLIIDDKDRRMDPGLDDIEAEIVYLLIREFKPENIVEISPGSGWSSSWILNAIKDNKHGNLYSYDIIDKAQKFLPKNLASYSWNFFQGDIKKNLNKLPDKIDYLFIDSDHSAKFCLWYIEKLFPKLKNNTLISVHDVFRSSD